jgi:hypothetical protein
LNDIIVENIQIRAVSRREDWLIQYK